MNSLTTRWTLITLSILMGCVSTPTITELNYPLPFIEKAIQSALVRVKSVSQNHREIVSDYMTTDGKLWDPLSNDRHRVKVTVFITGDRRPYDVDIETLVEERATGKPGYSAGFTPIGKSSKLVEEITFRIRNYLVQNSKRNLIDDFRPF